MQPFDAGDTYRKEEKDSGGYVVFGREEPKAKYVRDGGKRLKSTYEMEAKYVPVGGKVRTRWR